MLKHAFGKSWWRFDWEGNMATECYTVTVDEERSFYQYALSAFSGLHAAYELAKLDTRTNSLLFILASSLHAFARYASSPSQTVLVRKKDLSHSSRLLI